MTDAPPDAPRLVAYWIGERELRGILDLPDRATVAFVDTSVVKRHVRVVVHDPEADPIYFDSEPPIVHRGAALERGVGLIRAERRRQIDVEGYKPAHDADHEPDALALAGAMYATPAEFRELDQPLNGQSAPVLWPFQGGWKPTPGDRLRELVKAGALIAAEIDRLLIAEGAR